MTEMCLDHFGLYVSRSSWTRCIRPFMGKEGRSLENNYIFDQYVLGPS